MYLIPKNIKVKREIFRGYGVKEIVLLGFSILIGFILSKFFGTGLVKVFLFSFFPTKYLFFYYSIFQLKS